MSTEQNNQQPRQNLPEMTVIGPDTKIKGEMFFEKSARILGSFEGKITAQGEVQIGAGALCNAAVEADRVIVDGRVHGPITARDRLTLTANAQVQGDLTAGTLVVAEGASFVGHCHVGPHAQELSKGNSAEQSREQHRQERVPASQTEAKPTNNGSNLDMTPPWARTNAGAA
ncbi:MAG: polymer-forming cytoskeletal protein [Phycisphaerales bacterium]|nr:polymer-forming cytoskeletal protein [Planctomycetota bacterium]MCH8508812.1 polymer-forming cytoskeletal protein [Phycisphaerales bacterium]